MTTQELRDDITSLQIEIDLLKNEVPTNAEEYMELRMKYDIASSKMQGYQMQLQAFSMIAQIDSMVISESI